MAQPRWIRVFVVLLALPVLAVGGIATAGVVLDDVPVSGVDGDVGNISGPVIETDAADTDRLNETAIALAVHAEINAERRARGLSSLSYQNATAQRAAEHSATMAAAGELTHSNTETQYRCRAGENIMWTFAYQEHRTPAGEYVENGGNETKIAQEVVRAWLNSPPHRQNLFDSQFSAEGIGIATVDDEGTKVYVTQALCV